MSSARSGVLTCCFAVLALALGATSGRAETCSPGAPTVKYNGKTFTVTFCASGAASECSSKPCYAGATLRRAKDAFQYDLPAKEVDAEALRAPVTLAAKPGTGFVEYVVGVWPEKQKCSGSKRHGCKEYGYVLAGGEPHWSFPDDAYWGPKSSFTKIKPSRVQVLDAGGGEDLVARARTALTGWTLTDGGKAIRQRDFVVVLYRAKWGRGEAWTIAKKLRDANVGVRWDVEHWHDAPEAFVVALGNP